MKVEEFGAGNRIISDVQSGDKVEAGELGQTAQLEADFENFDPFFNRVQKNANAYINADKNDGYWNGWKEHLTKLAGDFDANFVMHMDAFQKVMDAVYPNRSEEMSENPMGRIALFATAFCNRESIPISKTIEKGYCACIEHSILAAEYCKRNGFDVDVFSGSWVKAGVGQSDMESEKHTWIMLKTENGNYIYDPANPIRNKGHSYPRISKLEVSDDQLKEFSSKIRNLSENGAAYLHARDIILKRDYLYGCTPVSRAESKVSKSEIISAHDIFKENNPLTAINSGHGSR